VFHEGVSFPPLSPVLLNLGPDPTYVRFLDCGHLGRRGFQGGLRREWIIFFSFEYVGQIHPWLSSEEAFVFFVGVLSKCFYVLGIKESFS